MNYIEFYRDWYKGMTLPTCLDGNFGKFASYQSIAEQIFPGIWKRATIKVDSTRMARTNGQVIYIPTHYFHPAAYQGLTNEESVLTALCKINGSLLHEFLHIELSTFNGLIDNATFVKMHPGNHSLFDTHPELLLRTLGVVEDIFIESTLQGLPYRIVMMKNDAILSLETFKEWASNFEMSLKSIMGVMALFKNERVRGAAFWQSTPWLAELHSLLSQAADKSLKKQDRARIAGAITGHIIEAIPPREAEKQDGMDYTSLFGTGGTQGPEDEKSYKGIVGKRLMSDDQRKYDGAIAAFCEFGYEGKGGLDYEITPVMLSLESVRPTCPRWFYEGGEPLTAVREAFKYRGKANARSLPRRSGPRLLGRKLAGYRHDDRIFGSHQAITKTDPEIIVLVDSSGSMSVGPNSLWHYALRAARGLSRALQGAPHSVYGHTTRDVGQNSPNSANSEVVDEPVIYPIAGHGMGIKNLPDAWERAASITERGCNYDGLAIEAVSKQFKGRGAKWLIVISDGKPRGQHYEDGIGHTIGVVQSLRKAGVNIVSISLTAGAYTANNDIYGPDSNAYAPQGRGLEAALTDIIKNNIL